MLSAIMLSCVIALPIVLAEHYRYMTSGTWSLGGGPHHQQHGQHAKLTLG
jgi:hypothetical protein